MSDPRRLPSRLAPLVLISLAACAGPRPGFERPELAVPTPEGLVDAGDPQPISEIAWRYGPAPWVRDGFGDPRITAELGGIPYIIEFYGCAEGRDCTELRFVARFLVMDADEPDQPASRQALVWQANRWNSERRFGKASATEAPGEILIELNTTLAGGVTRQNLDAVFDWWRVILADFEEFTET